MSNIDNPDTGKQQPQHDRKPQPGQMPQDGEKKQGQGQGMPGRKGDLDQQDEKGTGGKKKTDIERDDDRNPDRTKQ